MRTFAKSILAAAVAAVGFASAASAISVGAADITGGYNGPIDIKFKNFDEGRVYNTAAGGGVLGPGAGVTGVDNPANWVYTPKGAYNGDDGWGIFKVTGIFKAGTADVLWLPNDVSHGNFEITGVFYGLNDTSVFQAGTVQIINSINMKIQMYADNTTLFDETPGPLAGHPSNDKYATATDGQLIWTGNTVAGPGGVQFQSLFNTATTSSFGEAYGNFGTVSSDEGPKTGTLNNMFTTLPVPQWHLLFTATNATAAGITPVPASPWLLYSNDPFTANVTSGVPTPSAVWGGALLAGLIGVNAYRRRRAE